MITKFARLEFELFTRPSGLREQPLRIPNKFRKGLFVWFKQPLETLSKIP